MPLCTPRSPTALCSLAFVASRSALVDATSVFTPPTSVFTPAMSPATAVIAAFCASPDELSAAFCSACNCAGPLRQLFLRHAGLLRQSLFLSLGGLHAVLQLLDLRLAGSQIASQLFQRQMRRVMSISGSRPRPAPPRSSESICRRSTTLHVYLFAFIGHTLVSS